MYLKEYIKMKSLFVAVFALAASYVALNPLYVDERPDITLSNVEALANGESGPACCTDVNYINPCNYYDNAVPCPCGM